MVSSTASRTMIWSGLLILGFVVYHLLDLTIGVVCTRTSSLAACTCKPRREPVARDRVHRSTSSAMIGLGFHLWHGLWSMFQSLGITQPRHRADDPEFAIAAAVILTLGFSAVPLAVIVGLVG